MLPEFLCCMSEREQRARGLLGSVGPAGWGVGFCAVVSIRAVGCGVLNVFPVYYYSSSCNYIEL